MARRNIYLTDDLDRRVRAAIDAGQLDASDVCASALGRALNGHQPAAVELHQDRADVHPGPDLCAVRLDAIERTLAQLVTAAGLVLLVVAAGIVLVSVRTLATA